MGKWIAVESASNAQLTRKEKIVPRHSQLSLDVSGSFSLIGRCLYRALDRRQYTPDPKARAHVMWGLRTVALNFSVFELVISKVEGI